MWKFAHINLATLPMSRKYQVGHINKQTKMAGNVNVQERSFNHKSNRKLLLKFHVSIYLQIYGFQDILLFLRIIRF